MQLTYLDHASFCRISGQHELFNISTEEGDPPPGVFCVAQRFNQVRGFKGNVTYLIVKVSFCTPSCLRSLASLSKISPLSLSVFIRLNL